MPAQQFRRWVPATGILPAAGAMVDALRYDYGSLAHRKGLPAGHVPIVRQLVVPVVRGEQIVAVLGVGNKAIDYTDEDVTMISVLADLAWDVVESKRADATVMRRAIRR